MNRPKIIIRKQNSLVRSPRVSMDSPAKSEFKLQISQVKSVQAQFRNKSQVQAHRIIKAKSKQQDSLHHTICSMSGNIKQIHTDRDELECSLIQDSVSQQGNTVMVWKSPLRINYTAWFPYPDVCQKQRQQENCVEIPLKGLTYKIHGQVPFKCVMLAFEAAGFSQVEGDKWNVLWGMASKETLQEMDKYQKVNHFPNCWSIGRKDNLWINLSKMKRIFPKEYSFIPNTYLLAYDYKRFQLIREGASKRMLWIKKPVAAARGQGIKLVTKTTKIQNDKNYLIMDYISNPHLINNFKYDLRVYVVITSVDPLRVYMYQDGLVRFATEQYSTNKKDLKKRYIHLTNFAVNKESPNFQINDNVRAQQGSKWSHQQYKVKLQELGVDADLLFHKIEDIIIKTCIAFEPLLSDQNGKSSQHKTNYFELYGFDVLVDQNLKPWVLEVNVSPSLNSSSNLDAQIKTSLISDMMHLVGVQCKKTRVSRISKSFQRNLNDIPNFNNQNLREKVNKEDINVLLTSLEEQMRLGDFKCLYPNRQTIQKYEEYFEYPRFHNKLIQKYYEDGCTWQF